MVARCAGQNILIDSQEKSDERSICKYQFYGKGQRIEQHLKTYGRRL